MKFGCVPQTQHEWMKKAEFDDGNRAHVAQRRGPSRLSERARRDLDPKPKIAGVFAENFAVYSVRKVWRQMRREGAGMGSALWTAWGNTPARRSGATRVTSETR